jgi:hypothetical protein
MPRVLTTNAAIRCAHGAPAVKNPPLAPLWTIDGGHVQIEGDSGTFPTCPSAFQCVGYVLRSMGLNATRMAGPRVILVTDFNQSASGLPITMSELHNVFDDTTPAPIPDGQPAPPLPPDMADLDPPIVSVSPATLAFNATSGSPPSLAVTFTLTAAHPLRWILTQIDEPEEVTNDRSSTQPPGMTVSPSGGVWGVSPLTITLTMTAAFMTTLMPLKHRFFLTGVTRRGLSSFAEAVLNVSV